MGIRLTCGKNTMLELHTDDLCFQELVLGNKTSESVLSGRLKYSLPRICFVLAGSLNIWPLEAEEETGNNGEQRHNFQPLPRIKPSGTTRLWFLTRHLVRWQGVGIEGISRSRVVLWKFDAPRFCDEKCPSFIGSLESTTTVPATKFANLNTCSQHFQPQRVFATFTRRIS